MKEKSKETDVFGKKKESIDSKYQTGKTASVAVVGAAVGMVVSAFSKDDSESIEPELNPGSVPTPPIEAEITSESIHNRDTTNHEHEEPESKDEIVSDSLPEPKITVDVESEVIAEPEKGPVMPVEEIDLNDNELTDVIEDVTTVEVVYDINGNPMLVATAHNPADGEFYLVDVDMDGDFDVVLNSAGVPVAELTGENDRLITVTDVESKVTDDYIARNEIDDMIANTDMIGERIQNDIIIVDEGA